MALHKPRRVLGSGAGPPRRLLGTCWAAAGHVLTSPTTDLSKAWCLAGSALYGTVRTAAPNPLSRASRCVAVHRGAFARLIWPGFTPALPHSPPPMLRCRAGVRRRMHSKRRQGRWDAPSLLPWPTAPSISWPPPSTPPPLSSTRLQSTPPRHVPRSVHLFRFASNIPQST